MSPPRFRPPQKPGLTQKISSPALPRFALPGSSGAAAVSCESAVFSNAPPPYASRRIDGILDVSQDGNIDVNAGISLEAVTTPDENDDMLFDLYNKLESPSSRKRTRVVAEDTPRALVYSPRKQASRLRPSFVVPASPKPPPIETTLPDIFSPQRPKHSYVPSGLAASVRAEIVQLISENMPIEDIAVAPGTKLLVKSVNPMPGFAYVDASITSSSAETIQFLLMGIKQCLPKPSDHLIVKGLNWNVNAANSTHVVLVDWTVTRPATEEEPPPTSTTSDSTKLEVTT